jgi:hypothetical protein
MGYTEGFQLMEEVIKKLSRGRIISSMLDEAFTAARTAADTDFSEVDYHELCELGNEYDNQIKYKTSTVNSNGEFNNPYQSLFELSDRLRGLAERIIETHKRKED